MMDPIIGGAVVGGLGSLASDLITNSGNKKSQDRANQFNVDAWNRQNSYNHPIEQMARLKSAGLNPNLIYGSSPGSATGNSDKIAPAKASEYKLNNPLESINSFANLKQTATQTDNVASQTDVNVQEALLKSQQTAKTLTETSKNAFDLDLAKELRSTSADLAKENLRKMRNQASESQIDLIIKDRNQANLVKEVKARVELLQANKQNTEASTELRKLEGILKASGMENSGPIMRSIFKNQDKLIDLIPFGKQIKKHFKP